MNQAQNRIESIKENGYTLEFENVFNLVFENYKKIAIYAGLIIFVFSVLFFATVFISLSAYFGMETITDMLKPENLKPENLSKEFILIYSGCAIIFTCLISPFTAGFLKMAYCADKDQEFPISALFQYYKLSYFIELFIATFFITIFNTGITNALDLAGLPIVGSIITMLVSFYTLLTIPLIIFGKLKALEAIRTSIMIISKQPLVILSLVAVSMVAAIVGLIVFCIGVLFTIPFLYSLYYILYKEIIGFEEIE
ncbi:hypothetical protein SLW70_11525 [Flavobacterium sp. NG2]|uniref:hypothetical protein n=1 Tax=Flavobacterium sp. NG2 TaxID=3097547 RepID=UPI002A83F5DC|nr:hypothetical protein [Flavobacterium sp. NG2]WPR70562.1 hypothetical protein SLW70_11525 [Flavobacterium sp. NG2]